MASTIYNAFEYEGKEPNFSRDTYETISAMAGVNNKKFPQMFIATNQEDGKVYVYNKSISNDPVLKKWREITSKTDQNMIAIKALTSFENVDGLEFPEGTVVEYAGETSDTYEYGNFYKVTKVETVAVNSTEKTIVTEFSPWVPGILTVEENNGVYTLTQNGTVVGEIVIPESVKSVNGVEPDENGDVAITVEVPEYTAGANITIENGVISAKSGEGTVKSVNGVEPDASGNVELSEETKPISTSTIDELFV